ncbi:MAG: restriction endonuclease, partial [Ignavibacteriae bacterium]|nr:restriction endonuclease [Ignavibacteriota bacterium]
TEETTESSGNEEVEINPEEVKGLSETEKSKEQLKDILDLAHTTNTEFEKKLEELDKEDNLIPTELKDKIKSYVIKETFREEAKEVNLPSFFIKTTPSLIEEENYVELSKGLLLKGFDLDKEESKIELTRTASQMYRVDLTEIRANESVPEYRKERENVKDAFIKYISTLSPEAKINQIAGRLNKIIKKIDEIPEPQIIAYIKKTLEPLDSDKISEIANNEIVYADIFKKRIKELASNYAEKRFIRMLDKGDVVCKPTFTFPKKISPKNTEQGITKNLYIQEGEINPFEKKVINEVANLDSVVFWHRNLERNKGFQLNGFINHYPDFIVKMKNGKTILIEAKGDHLDGSDSQQKLSLGEKWASKAGDEYRYFMVFESDRLDGAKT